MPDTIVVSIGHILAVLCILSLLALLAGALLWRYRTQILGWFGWGVRTEKPRGARTQGSPLFSESKFSFQSSDLEFEVRNGTVIKLSYSGRDVDPKSEEGKGLLRHIKAMWAKAQGAMGGIHETLDQTHEDLNRAFEDVWKDD